MTLINFTCRIESTCRHCVCATYLNTKIALRIFFTLPVTVDSSETSLT